MAYSIPVHARDGIDAIVKQIGLSTGEAINRLTFISRGTSPAQPLLVILARHDEAIPQLLRELELSDAELLERARADDSEDRVYLLHRIAIYLLALFEEPRAYPALIRYLAADTHAAEEQLDDMVTEDLTAIVARIYDGSDLASLKSIVEDPNASIYVRSALLSSLHALERRGRLDRDIVVDYFAYLLTTCCTPAHADFAGLLVDSAAQLKEARLLPLIERFFEAGLIDTTMLPRADIDAFFGDTQDDIDRCLLQSARFDTLIDYICGWSWFQDQSDDPFALVPTRVDGGASVARRLAWVAQNTFPPNVVKPGRNEPCHCGSTMKYKKCCLPIGQLQ